MTLESNKYTITNIIEDNYFGCPVTRAHLANDPKKTVIIKSIDKTRLEVFVADDGKFVPKELLALKKIEGMTEFVQLLDFYESSTHSFVVMEDLSVDYVDLNKLIFKECHYFNDGMVTLILRQTIERLIKLSNMNIFYTDIKLENIMIKRDLSTIKLIDFADVQFDSPIANKEIGTSEYFSPEMIVGKSYDILKSATFAVGCLGYILVVRDYPFYNKFELRNLPPPLVSDWRPFKEFIKYSLMKNPESRLSLQDLLGLPLFAN